MSTINNAKARSKPLSASIKLPIILLEPRLLGNSQVGKF